MSKLKVVAFLQNAWSPVYAGRTWPRASWIDALKHSRSGHRLRIISDACNDGQDIWYDNTTPIVGATADSVVAPDEQHIKAVLAEQKPKAVVTLGKQALESVLPIWNGPMLALPHPAYRVLTDDLYHLAATILKSRSFGDLAGWPGLIELRQGKGRVEVYQEK